MKGAWTTSTRLAKHIHAAIWHIAEFVCCCRPLAYCGGMPSLYFIDPIEVVAVVPSNHDFSPLLVMDVSRTRR